MTALAALRPAQAKAPAAAAPAPVVAQALESLQLDSGPVSSLSRIPLFAPPAPPPPPSVSQASGEAVQRKCETCEAEENDEGTKVRARLEVGAADDPFEHEADAIAHSVMAMPESDLTRSVQGASGAAPLVQRACAACNATRDEQISARRIDEEDLALGTVRRRTDGLSADADESEAPRMRGEAEGDAAPGLAATSGELTTGGAPLSASARQFFEPRMGRDLSHVRVHSGHASSGFSRSIGARAFTYRNHIWLGRSERHEVSFTMAHELAHVLQQTAPGPVGPTGQTPAVTCAVTSDTPLVRRAAPFFHSRNARSFQAQHQRMHTAAQAAARRVNSELLTEVPIPGANRYRIASEKCGFADFYTAREVAIEGNSVIPIPGLKQAATGSGVVNFNSRIDLADCRRFPWTVKRGSSSIPSIRNAQSQRRSGDDIIRLEQAPQAIRIGELKPAHDLAYRGRGVTQINNYQNGLHNTIQATDTYLAQRAAAATAAAGGTAAAGHNLNWGASRPGAYTGLTIPSGWADDGSNTTSYPVPDLRIRTDETLPPPPIGAGGAGRTRPRRTSIRSGSTIEIRGRWRMAEDSTHAGTGMYVYYLAPNPDHIRQVLADVNTTERFAETARAIQRVLVPLRTAPVATPDTTRRSRRLPETESDERQERIQTKVVVRRRMQDNFNRNQWNAMRGAPGARAPSDGRPSLADTFATEAPADVRERLKQANGIAQWLEDPLYSAERTNYSVDPGTTGRISAAATQMNVLQRAAFWSSRRAGVIGILRQRFGGVFVRAFNAFERFRDRIHRILERRRRAARRRASRGGIMRRAALKVMGLVLPMLIMPIVRQTLSLVTQCIRTGFTAKMQSLFPDESPIATLQDMAENLEGRIDAMRVDIESAISGRVNAIVEHNRQRIEQIVSAAENVRRVIEGITEIANALRIGTCVVSLATAPETLGVGAVVGCGAALIDAFLSRLGLSPIDYIVALTVQSCDSVNTIGRLMNGFDIIRQLPGELASRSIGALRTGIREFVPTTPTLQDRPLNEHAVEALCDETSMTVPAVPFDEQACAAVGGIDSGLPSVSDVPVDVPLYRDGDPITAAERRHMYGREGPVGGTAANSAPSAPNAEGAGGTGGSTDGDPASPGNSDAPEAESDAPSDMTVNVSNVVISNEDLASDRTIGVTLTLSGAISADRSYHDETIIASLEAHLSDGVVLGAANRRFRITSVPGQSGNSTVTGWPIETLTWRYIHTRADGTRIERANSLVHDRERPFTFYVQGAAE